MAKWFINAGHGPKDNGTFDPGAIGPGGTREADITIRYCGYIARYLVANGEQVVSAAGGNPYQDGDLDDIYNLANSVGADFFYSGHSDSFGDPAVGGTGMFIYPGSAGGRKLAQNILDELVPAIGLNNRGIKEANFAVLAKTAMAAVLQELAFLSNPKEEALLKNDAWLKVAAKATVKGMLKNVGKNTFVDPDQQQVVTTPAVDQEKEQLKARVAQLEEYKVGAEKDFETLRNQLIIAENRAVAAENEHKPCLELKAKLKQFLA